MAKESGLGQGLGALFGSLGTAPEEFLAGNREMPGDGVTSVSLALIDNDTSQPRKQFADDKLEELAKSIRTHGIMQPLIVARTESGRYRIIAGERRFRASKIAGLEMVPVVVREQVEDRDALEMALIENIQREDLNPMEQAAALQRLVREYGMKQEEIAERVGKSRSAVANLMRLLNLPAAVQKMVETEEISAGHARTLLPLQNETSIVTAADWIKKQDLSVRETEELVRTMLSQTEQKESRKPAKPKLPPELREAMENLSAQFDTKVRIVGNLSKGRITIDYYSEEQLNNLYEVLQGKENVTE